MDLNIPFGIAVLMIMYQMSLDFMKNDMEPLSTYLLGLGIITILAIPIWTAVGILL